MALQQLAEVPLARSGLRPTLLGHPLPGALCLWPPSLLSLLILPPQTSRCELWPHRGNPGSERERELARATQPPRGLKGDTLAWKGGTVED